LIVFFVLRQEVSVMLEPIGKHPAALMIGKKRTDEVIRELEGKTAARHVLQLAGFFERLVDTKQRGLDQFDLLVVELGCRRQFLENRLVAREAAHGNAWGRVRDGDDMEG